MAIWLTPQAECNRSVACGFAVPIALFADSSASRECAVRVLGNRVLGIFRSIWGAPPAVDLISAQGSGDRKPGRRLCRAKNLKLPTTCLRTMQAWRLQFFIH